MLGIVLGTYIGTILLLNIPYVQRQMSVWVANELTSVLGSNVSIGRINMGLLNRIIIDDLLMDDQQGKEMLKVTRLSAKFELLPLFNGKISISSVQLFGFNIHLNKATPKDKPNFQFVIDAFASKDTIPKQTHLDLRINSLLIRRGRLAYDVLSEAETPGKFNARHVSLHNIIANISLKALQNDSIHAAIKRLSVEEEQSGFELKKLSLRMVGNQQQMEVDNFAIELPNTQLAMKTIRMDFDSLGAFGNFAEEVRFSFHLLPSEVALQDFSAFVPAFKTFKEKVEVEVQTEGSIDQLECPLLSVSAGSDFYLRGNVSLQDLSNPQSTYVYGKLSNLYADKEGIAFLVRNLSKEYKGVPPALQHLGTVSFRGEVSGYFDDLVTYGQVKTDLGTVNTDLKLSSDKEKGYFAYSGSVKTADFELGKLLGNKKLDKVTFNLDVNSSHREGHYPSVVLKGLVASLGYSGYTYENITLDGQYKQGGFMGKVALDDPNGGITLDGMINTTAHVPTFNFRASIDNFRPNALNLTPKYEETAMSVKINADFTGGSIDEMNGEINIDSLQLVSPAVDYRLGNLKITAANMGSQQDEAHKRLTVESDFLQASIEGDYSYRTLPVSVMNILRRYIPALIKPSKNKQKKPVETENNFQFAIHIYNTEQFSTAFQLPLTVYTHSTVSGYFHDKLQRLRVEGYFPRFLYEKRYIESGMFLCENPGDRFHAHLRFNERKSEGAVNVSLEAQAKNDSLQATLNWGNSGTATYSGKLAAAAHFVREEQSPSLRTVVDIQPTQVILNDTLWKIHPSQVVVDSGKVHVNDFYFSHRDRHLRINGTVSPLPEDTVRLDLKQINIGYVFDIADLGVNFKGEATGPAFAAGVLDKPVMSTDLHIHNFGLNDGQLGEADIHGEWHHDVKGIYLDARMQEIAPLNPPKTAPPTSPKGRLILPELSLVPPLGGLRGATTHVLGYVYPLKPTSSLDLQIHANGTNLKFIHYFMDDITSEFTGRAWGDVHFYGKFKALTMEGRVFGDATMKADVLNTSFTLKDSIYIAPDGLTFNNNRVYDTQGHEGRMSGYLRYQHFKNLEYRFNFDVSNMLVMNTKESPDYPFYGTIYGTGNCTLAGNARDGLNIDVALTTNRNTDFTYVKDYVTTAVSNEFITFVDKTPRRQMPEEVEQQPFVIPSPIIDADTDIRLNLLVEATPDATLRIIMDPIAGDYISGRGTGSVRTEFYNKADDVKMFGTYRISSGIYKFSLQEVIRKDFTIRDGSTISFNGSPVDATLDIHAGYTVNSASLNDLMPTEATSGYINQTNVKVNCMMNLTGQLTSPDIKFDIELPNERDEIQAIVRNYIPTDEQMNMQILYLLAIGKFYTPENLGATQNSNMMSSMVSSTLSGQLNNALSNILDLHNWNFGTNFSTGERGWTDMEFETMLSGQLLDNRLLINGNFGYRDNPLANTNFVGDFEAEWLVNRSGDIRLKAYNETNDRYYTRTNLTTQGIGIIFKKDFNTWSELFFWNKWRAAHLKQKSTPADTLTTSKPEGEGERKIE